MTWITLKKILLQCFDRLEDLDFADDLFLLSEEYRETQARLGDLTQEARKVGLAINVKKTKAPRINTNKKRTVRARGTKISRMWEVLYIWVVGLPKTEGLHGTWYRESKKWTVLLYNFTQYGGIIRYRLGPNSASSVATYGSATIWFWDTESGKKYNVKATCVLILCFRASQYKSNETPTWCNTVQLLFLRGHSTCFGRKRPSSGVFKTSTAATGTCVIVAGKSSHLLIRAGTECL